MEVKREDYRFKIGDFVCTIGTLILSDLSKDDSYKVRYQVIERSESNCPGGYQRQYKCRPYILQKYHTEYELGRDIAVLNEVELVSLSEYGAAKKIAISNKKTTENNDGSENEMAVGHRCLDSIGS